LGELGYEWAYRVLDAQWFGVAQRRRRVFVVAHLGKGNLAAKVLFESESVRRNPAPSREAGKGTATNVAPSLTASNDPSRSPQSSEVTQQVNAVMQAIAEREVCGCLSDGAHMGGGLNGQDAYSRRIMAVRTEPVIIDRAAFNQGQNAQYKPHIEHSETMDSLVARGPHAVAFQTSELRLTGKLTEKSVCPTLKANTKAGDTEVKVVLYENHPNDSRVTGPHDVAPSCVSRYGTGGGNVPLVQEAVPFRDPSPTLTSKMQGQAGWAPYNEDAHLVGAVAVDVYNQAIDGNTAATLTSACGGTNTSGPKAMQSMAVRRLSPKECERLQGFPDDHTLIPWRNKPADQCPDGPRYKALGNSMAVPCMAWIGKRIDAVEKTK